LNQWIHGFFLSISPQSYSLELRVRKRRRTERGEESSAWVQIRLNDSEFGKNLAFLSIKIAAHANPRFKFKKRRQLFVGTDDELSRHFDDSRAAP
jgi:hypothetical protein